MTRPWHIWAVFGLCLAVAIGAVGWLSVTVLELERAEVQARRHAIVEENVRLAMWRMESVLAPLIARESARPYFTYSSFYPAERAYTRMFSEIEYGDVLVPSPLLMRVSPHIVVHFQVDTAGVFSSPQVPVGNMRDLAEAGYVDPADIEVAAGCLADLRERLDAARLAARLPLETPAWAAAASAPIALGDDAVDAPARQVSKGQWARNQLEVQVRNRALQQIQVADDNVWNDVNWAASVMEGVLNPIWTDGVLLLARRVAVNGTEYVQGCRLDWTAIERWLAAEIADLFPHARFAPLSGTADDDGARVLAALPVRLEPGEPAFDAPAVESPVRLSLLIAWICMLLAAAAVVALLFGTISLSERRGAFVSAVTHELRTPLTTFRLYTDMLADGMVPDEAKRRDYLNTMHAEATRLAHLVENVLAYARLERGRGGGRVERVLVAELLSRVSERLADRAAGAGVQLVVEPLTPVLEGTCVRADARAVEQILFNLVDNACKYAGMGERKEICVRAERVGDQLRLCVRDYGPGIAPAESARLFQPFHKSAREAADTAPGVGLGLALSRRLARQLGGDLRLARVSGEGACFELFLRVEAP